MCIVCVYIYMYDYMYVCIYIYVPPLVKLGMLHHGTYPHFSIYNLTPGMTGIPAGVTLTDHLHFTHFRSWAGNGKEGFISETTPKFASVHISLPSGNQTWLENQPWE